MQRLVRRGISRLPRKSKSSLYEFNQVKMRAQVRASDYSMLDVAEVIAVRNKTWRNAPRPLKPHRKPLGAEARPETGDVRLESAKCRLTTVSYRPGGSGR
jgi:hypothetical protein